MYKITFKYRDKYSYPNWNTQHCEVASLQDCINFYGLGEDCEYEIIEVKKVKQAGTALFSWGVVQFGRTLVLGTRGHGFKSRYPNLSFQ